MSKDNPCTTCTYYTANGRCNRLVYSGIGMSDRLGSDFKKGNKCAYYKSGCHNRDKVIEPLNFWNS